MTPVTSRLPAALRATSVLSSNSRDNASSATSAAESASNNTPVRLGSSFLNSANRQTRDSVLGEAGSTQSSQQDTGAPEDAGNPASAQQMAESTKAQVAVDSAIANDTAGLEAARSAFENNLTKLANDPEAFHDTLKKSFGDSYDKASAETIRQQVLNGDFSWMPDIKVVDASALQDQSGTQTSGTALGAYSKDTDTIYISRQLLNSDPDKAAQILTEEVGHGLDARLNTSDAAGDEGDIFARLVGGEKMSDAELSALKAENDSGTIIVDGKEIEVEYGLFKKIKKGIKRIGKSIKKGVSRIAKGIKKGFKKIMQSKLLGTILTIAQFIPIPVVQVAVRVANVVRAAYQVYQGVKHGSISAVLGGVAGVAGGVGNLGKALGASARFVDTAGRIARGAGTAASAYQALAKGNFAAAAGIASNYFGGSGTQTGRAFNTAGQAFNTVQAVRNGDIPGAIQSGRSVYNGLYGAGTHQDLEGERLSSSGSANDPRTAQRSGFARFVANISANETYQAIINNVGTVRDIVRGVREGDISGASANFLSHYGDDLGIGADTQKSIQSWAGVIDRVVDTKDAIDNGHYASAIDQAAGLLGIPVSEANQNRLRTVFALRDSVLADQYSNASRQAASLALQSGNAQLASNFFRLAHLLDGDISLSGLQNNQAA